MLWKKINPGDVEQGFRICRAESAITKGQVVGYTSTASTTYPLGVGVDLATAGNGRVAGVAYETVAAGELFRVQCSGYCDYVLTDGAVASTDLHIYISGTDGTAEGATNAEVDSKGNAAAIQDRLGWNIVDDSSTTGAVHLQGLV